MKFFSDFINTIAGLFSFAIPLITEFMADFCVIILLACQIILSLFSSTSLTISKFFFYLSKFSHKKSEEIINRLWIN